MGSGGGFDVRVIASRPGFISLKISGNGADSLRKTEPGGHRWQEASGKKKQIHTSTITVAVLTEEKQRKAPQINLREVRFDTYVAQGAGGQHKNRTLSAVRVTHLPTGITARAENSRSQHKNKETALTMLAEKISNIEEEAVASSRSRNRKEQVGCGMRSDKIRTIRTQDGTVTCHRTGAKSRVKTYLRGDLGWLEESM